VFVHADDIKIHEQFFNFTKHFFFFLFKQDKLVSVLTCSMHMHCRPIDEGKIVMRHTHDTTLSEKNLDFYQILEESEQFFILFLKKMENLRRIFSIFLTICL
jgi:hypothetical protein